MSDNRLSNGRFNVGHALSKVMPNIGKPKRWESPDGIYNDFYDYVQYCNDNPLIEIAFLGKDADQRSIPKMRAMTVMGFCAYCGTSHDVLAEYGKRDGYNSVVAYIRNYFSSSNIEGAAAFLLNANIISRIEGLVDKKQVEGNVVTNVVFHIPQIEAPKAVELEEGDDWDII